MNENTVFAYARNNKRQKVGILAAFFDNTRFHVGIGWSRCRKGDKFDREAGLKRCQETIGTPVPQSLMAAAKRFRVQCFQHFENATHIQHIEVMPCPRMPKMNRPVKTVRNNGHRKGCPYDSGIYGSGTYGPGIRPCFCGAVGKFGSLTAALDSIPPTEEEIEAGVAVVAHAE